MSDTSFSLERASTALVLIDLQTGIVGRPLEPRSGPEVVANAARLADGFRAVGAFIVFVRVTSSGDGKDMPHPVTDVPPMTGARAPGWDQLVPEIRPEEGALTVTKRQWGAFYGTELDLQLRRRGIKTIVLGGIATNMGVESTARSAFEHGYEQVLVEDAMASMSAEMHEFAVKNVFPRMGRVRSTVQVLEALV
jgi:nicotinamidase-related amidase